MNKHRQKHHDVVIQDYFVDNNIPWTITIPTLFEHTGVVSSLGHDVGQSILYKGNIWKYIKRKYLYFNNENK